MTLKLKTYIPLSAPAAFEPIEKIESNFSVSFGFEPLWFSNRCDVDFSYPWHNNPYYRYQSLVKMNNEMKKSFPSLKTFHNYDDFATLSGVYGTCLMASFFDFPLLYRKNGWPVLDPSKPLMTKENIAKLNVDKILSGPGVENLIKQMDIIQKEWGKIHGFLNFQGILNNAFHLRGQDIFIDIFEDPQFVHHFFNILCELMIRVSKLVQEKQRSSGYIVDQFVVANCTVNMVSPEVYKEFVFPYDKKIADNFPRYGVHTCNWNVSPYLDDLVQLPKMGYLDMGMMSDLPKVKKLFADTNISVFYSAVSLQDLTMDEIKKELEKIYRQVAPCNLVMADVQATTSDERINDFLKICSTLEELGI